MRRSIGRRRLPRQRQRQRRLRLRAAQRGGRRERASAALELRRASRSCASARELGSKVRDGSEPM
jgi:hypothetical protein